MIIDIRRELPDQQAELLRQALQHFAGIIELDDMVLGGGTALASRWSHRLSVDIDLFTSADAYRGIRPVLERRAEGWGESDGFASVRIHPNVIHCVLANGLEFSLGDGDDITHNPASAEREASTGVRLQSTAEIIARKIRARMVNQAAYYIRDAYDVVCCQEHDPEALSEALSCLELDERRSLRYDSTLDGLRLDDTMPLLAPVHGHSPGVGPMSGLGQPTDEELAQWSNWLCWRDPIEVLPASAFDCPANHVRPPRTALGQHIHDGAAARCMAGFGFRPSFIEFAAFVSQSGQDAHERGYLHELFLGLHPVERKLLWHNSGVTAYEWARALGNCGMSRAFVSDWINQWAPAYSTPVQLRKIADHWDGGRVRSLLTEEDFERLERTLV